MMAWLGALPFLVVAAAVVFVPGALVCWMLRIRGLALLALAPAVTTASLGLLAILYGAVGVVWVSWTVVGGCLGVVGVAALLGLLLRPRPADTPARRGGGMLMATGIGIGVVLTAIRLVLYIEEPAAISQTNDAVFHLNALEWILQTQNASSLSLPGVVDASGFYPGAWHAIASATALISGVSLPTAANLVSIVVGALAWPVGIAWFTRVVTGGSTIATAASGVLSAVMPAFPMLMVQWGVLYPYGLSVALLAPAAGAVIALPALLASSADRSDLTRTAVCWSFVAVAALGGVALAQPATVLAWVILVTPFLTAWGVRRLREHSSLRVAVAAFLLVLWAMTVLVWIVVTRSAGPYYWQPFRDRMLLPADIVLNGPVMLPYVVGASILMMVGIVAALGRSRHRWLVVAWAAVALLYAVAAGVGEPLLRGSATGAWYADPYRLAALMPVVAVPLAAVGLAAIVGWVSPRLARAGGDSQRMERGAEWGAMVIVAAYSVFTLAVAPVIQMPQIVEGVPDEQSRYAEDASSWLSPNERALLERLPDSVPEGARVIGNPSTGMGFGYMLSGRDVYPRTWAQPSSEAWDVISQRLRDADDDPSVCGALAVYGQPQYVLDFGEGETTPGRYVLPGMTGFDDAPGFELVDQDGEASLWRITACQ